MTSQQKIKSLLTETGIAHKQIKCFGSQILITCWSQDAATKFADVVSKFATVRGIVESLDDNIKNTHSIMRPSKHTVWRLSAFI